MLGVSELSVKVSEDRREERGVIEDEFPVKQRNKEEDEQVSGSIVKVMVVFFDWILQVLM
jgi:hypothetical protein